MSVMKTRAYNDFKSIISGSTTESLWHFETVSFFVVYARTISPVSYIVTFQSSEKPATFATDFPGSNLLEQPIDVL